MQEVLPGTGSGLSEPGRCRPAGCPATDQVKAGSSSPPLVRADIAEGERVVPS